MLKLFRINKYFRHEWVNSISSVFRYRITFFNLCERVAKKLETDIKCFYENLSGIQRLFCSQKAGVRIKIFWYTNFIKTHFIKYSTLIKYFIIRSNEIFQCSSNMSLIMQLKL